MPLFFAVEVSFFFISCDIFVSKFWGIGIIVSRNELEKREKKLLLLDNKEKVQKKLVIVLGRTLVAILCTKVEDLIFFLIRFVACISL